MYGPYKINVRTGALPSTGHKTYMISMPWQLAEQVPDDARFVPEFHADGILFRFVDIKAEQKIPTAPAWAKVK
jgi:hypothetical protein